MALHYRLNHMAARTVLSDADPKDWAWIGTGTRPSDTIFQRDRYWSLDEAKKMVVNTGAVNDLYNIASGFVGSMNAEGWVWQ